MRSDRHRRNRGYTDGEEISYSFSGPTEDEYTAGLRDGNAGYGAADYEDAYGDGTDGYSDGYGEYDEYEGYDEYGDEKRSGGVFFKIVGAVLAAAMLVTVGLLIVLDVLPGKFLIPLAVIAGGALLILLPLLLVRRVGKGAKIASSIISIILIAVLGTSSWYMWNTLDFMNSVSDESGEKGSFSSVISGIFSQKPGTSGVSSVTKKSFSVLISGCDQTGGIDKKGRTDVNMIVTVNPKTNEVLLTSIPRDYYVTLHSKKSSDKLTHSSLYGIEETIATVEDTFGIKIDYYLRVNFSTIIGIVDAMGGIDIESEYSFRTTGMKGMPELNGLTFSKGKNHVNGKEALAFCRERHAFKNGDLQRNKNQQQVIEGIIKKAQSSTTILTSYVSILDAVEKNMATSMSRNEMSQLIKMQLDKMPEWNITKQSVTGKIGTASCYTLGAKASVVLRDEESEAQAKEEIERVKKGEPKAETE